MRDPQPTDIVLFDGGTSEVMRNGLQEHPALVTRHWGEGFVNLHVFYDAGASEVRTQVTHREGARTRYPTWRFADEFFDLPTERE